ncbi:RcnB family protein [Frateuria terrea]|uniref:Regulator RcnB of Ni and Co efflux n=1 Tax=Frateuria terrea TaxID=529704 RepID=A0A1H6WK10_9GAMM|nr:RcnB family protein [Frateuria terrea]SEJ16066.1 regulator RcnB of Ni and Co efflux [Frateuria terrea]SFP55639.1 regulator RcnB of Ni and Co efflux [Frateuria terrea]
MKFLLSALIALPLLAASGAALADHDHDHHGHGNGHAYGHDHDRHDDDDRGWRADHRDWRDDDDHDRGWHGHGRHWERGRRYDGPIVIVRDYDHYRLRPPPRGYHWVRDDDDNYVLVAVATGIILDAVFH